MWRDVVFLYVLLIKRQSSEWKSKSFPRTQKFRLNKNRRILILHIFVFNVIMCYEYKHLFGKIKHWPKKFPSIPRITGHNQKKNVPPNENQNWFLLHYNAPTHWSTLGKEYLHTRMYVIGASASHILSTWYGPNFTYFFTWNQLGMENHKWTLMIA